MKQQDERVPYEHMLLVKIQTWDPEDEAKLSEHVQDKLGPWCKQATVIEINNKGKS